MNTQEKLNMLWKYLLLLVIAIGVFRMSDRPHHKRKKHHHDNHEMTVEVEKEIVNGDTVIVVEVNGEAIELDDLEELEHGFKWISKDGKEILMDLDGDGNHDHKEHKKDVKIFKRKIIIDDDN